MDHHTLRLRSEHLRGYKLQHRSVAVVKRHETNQRNNKLHIKLVFKHLSKSPCSHQIHVHVHDTDAPHLTESRDGYVCMS